LVPIAHLGAVTRASLRFDPSKNNQRRYILSAHDYEVGEIYVRTGTASVGRV
jgi:hypothetical protein